MPVAPPQLGNEGLSPDAHHVLLAGSVEGLRYPPLCPNCGAAAARPLPVAKAFMYNHGDDTGWSYRIARATPLFCDACIQRHRGEAAPVTSIDRLKSVVLTELALPGIGTAVFGLFILSQQAAAILRDVQRQWPILVLIGALLLIAALCFQAAWTNNAHRRVPMQTNTSQAFDFGDNGDSPFRTTSRTYAIRNANHAEAFERLNAERSRAWLAPTQRSREDRRFWIGVAIMAVLALAMYYVQAR